MKQNTLSEFISFLSYQAVILVILHLNILSMEAISSTYNEMPRNRGELQPFQKRIVAIELPKGIDFCEIIAPSFRKCEMLYLTVKIKTQYFLALYSVKQPDNTIVWQTPICCDGDQWKNCCKMIEDGCFVILPVQRDIIILVDLVEKQRQEIEHPYSGLYDSSVKLFTFRESKIFCIAETKKIQGQRQNSTTFSYFNWDCEENKKFSVQSTTIPNFKQLQQIDEQSRLLKVVQKSLINSRNIFFVEISRVQSLTLVQIRVTNRRILDQTINLIKQMNSSLKYNSNFEDKFLFQISEQEFLFQIKNNDKLETLRFPIVIYAEKPWGEAILKPLQLFLNGQPYQLPFDEVTKIEYENMDHLFMIKIKKKGWAKIKEQFLLVNKKTKNIQVIDERPECSAFSVLYRDIIYRKLRRENKQCFEILD